MFFFLLLELLITKHRNGQKRENGQRISIGMNNIKTIFFKRLMDADYRANKTWAIKEKKTIGTFEQERNYGQKD